jgi:serine/threonine protein kinase/Tol biopolymer transport system component
MTLKRGSLLNNRYLIVDILGLGGMGSVYKAVDKNLGVKVAVKENLFTSDEFASQFHREAVILAGLRHPNLPRVTDHFVIEEQGQYLVMDYIEGEDLRMRMDRLGALPEDEVITIGAAICDALSYLASRNPPIVHRDIKPGNVRITQQGEIFLVDFGLAKVWSTSGKTATGARAMTPGYSPPEQYGTARTDQRSDIYSLGATLYAALTTYIPEDAMSRAMGQARLTPIEETNPGVSQYLTVAIEKALAVRPDDRYQNAQKFKKALLNVDASIGRDTGEWRVSPAPQKKDDQADTSEMPPIDSQTIEDERNKQSGGKPPNSPGTPSPVYQESEPSEGGKKWIRFWWLYLLIGSIILFFVISTLLTNKPAAGIAVTPSQTVAEHQSNPVLSTMTQQVIGSNPTFTPPNPENISNLPTITNTPTLTATEVETLPPLIANTASPVPTPTMVGGGRGEIAFSSDRRGMPQIFLTDIESGEWRQLTDMSGGACQPSWNPDGRLLVFISPCEGNKEEYPGSAMFIIDVDQIDSEPIPLPTVPGGDYDPAWSPDGEYILFASNRTTGRPRIYKMKVDDQTVTLLSDKFARDMNPAWSPDGEKISYVSTYKGFKEIWIMDADGKNRRPFTKSTSANDLYPDWSNDGTVILFTQYSFSGNVPILAAGYYDENKYTEFEIRIGPVPMREAEYSPDGFWLVFEGWPEGGNHEIYIMTTNGASMQQVTHNPGYDFDPTWRPTYNHDNS